MGSFRRPHAEHEHQYCASRLENMMTRKRHLTAFLIVAALLITLLPTGSVARATLVVAEPFVDYYNAHQGMRVLGYPLSGLTQVEGHAAQYFEKGRIEDHRADATSPDWQFMYGRLTSELMERDQDGA